MVQCLPTLKSNILAQLSPSLFVLFLDPLNSFSIFRRTIIAFQCKYFVLIFHGPTVRKMFTLSHSVPTDVFWNKWCLSQGCSIQTRKLLPLMLQIKQIWREFWICFLMILHTIPYSFCVEWQVLIMNTHEKFWNKLGLSCAKLRATLYLVLIRSLFTLIN